jgi:hypothetical protein
MQAGRSSGVQWGDVPTWAGAMLTGLALLIAAITYRKSVRDSERTQASMVTVWVGVAGEKAAVHVKNGSNAAVYAVTIYYGGKAAAKGRSPYYRIRDQDSGFKGLGSWASLGPGEEKSAALKRNPIFDPEIPSLYFRDANGVDWTRDYRARLKRHDYKSQLSEVWYTGQGKFSFVLQVIIVAVWSSIEEGARKLRRLIQGIFKREAHPQIDREGR